MLASNHASIMSKETYSAIILVFILFTGMPLLLLEATRHRRIEKSVMFLGDSILAQKGKLLVLQTLI